MHVCNLVMPTCQCIFACQLLYTTSQQASPASSTIILPFLLCCLTYRRQGPEHPPVARICPWLKWVFATRKPPSFFKGFCKMSSCATAATVQGCLQVSLGQFVFGVTCCGVTWALSGPLLTHGLPCKNPGRADRFNHKCCSWFGLQWMLCLKYWKTLQNMLLRF